MSLIQTLGYITQHPLTKDRPWAAVGRFARWQLECRLRHEVKFDWIEGSKLVVQRGMTGATGNIYCGLHEFVDMAFLLHVLRPNDLFVDVGANIGSYTVLSSSVCGARTHAVEPDPIAAARLRTNVAANRIENSVAVFELALGSKTGSVNFTVGMDTKNHIETSSLIPSRTVKQARLDDIIGESSPSFIKLDVEGYESQVLLGAERTLRKPSLLAIATESDEEVVVETLNAAGFKHLYYDPFERALSRSSSGNSHSNALYVRDRESCEERVAGAPFRTVMGQSI